MSIDTPLPVPLGKSQAIPPLLVDEREAGRLLGGLCAKSIYNLRKAGKLPGIKIGTRILYRVSDLDRFCEQMKGGAT